VLNEQDEVVEEKVTALLPSSVLSGLADANWKERLSAVEKMTDVCWRFLWLIMLKLFFFTRHFCSILCD